MNRRNPRNAHEREILRQALLPADRQRCAICRVSLLTARQFYLDHDHRTGALRGLLCRQCNQGLGMFRDSVERLAAAIAYLETAHESLKKGETR